MCDHLILRRVSFQNQFKVYTLKSVTASTKCHCGLNYNKNTIVINLYYTFHGIC